jgi:hypothetical protein
MVIAGAPGLEINTRSEPKTELRIQKLPAI